MSSIQRNGKPEDLITYPMGDDVSYVTLLVAEYSNESENTEYKQLWRSDFLKVISAFANTQGGILHTGLDDGGKPVGVQNTKKMLEDIPNTIRNKLGIVPSIKLRKEEGKEVIDIAVKKSSVPISFNGKFYVRSGSTVQELKGNDLAELLLKAMNYSWDEQVEEDATLDELCTDTMDEFKRLAQERLPSIVKESNYTTILQKLRLLKDGKLTKAAILLFAKDPQKYCLQAVVKIGKFQSPSIIQTTDIVEGNLFNQLNTSMEILQTKYLLRNISFEGLHRRDILEYPYEALREVIINAIIHRNYTKPIQTQLRIYPNRLVARNPGKLSPEVPVEQLKAEHDSIQRNKLIASVFYYAGFIEAWGSGMGKILEECRKQDLPEPDFIEENGVMVVTLYKNIQDEEYLKKFNLNHRQMNAVAYVKSNGRIMNHDYQKINNISKRTASRDLQKLVSLGIFHKSSNTGQSTSYKLEINEEKNIISKGHERAILPICGTFTSKSRVEASETEESASMIDASENIAVQDNEVLTKHDIDQATDHVTDQVTGQVTGHDTGHDTGQVTGQVPEQFIRLLMVITGEMTRGELQKTLKLRHRDSFVDAYLKPALELSLIEMTIPDKPTSSKQKYRLTEKGKKLRNEIE
ncbi:MAG: putative DNA binding domain-containing protein [Candidatus Sabulitectum sp.]|nr:putative DNA binding domain-containing protein [Candidatus Sabulitectum sp.]